MDYFPSFLLLLARNTLSIKNEVIFYNVFSKYLFLSDFSSTLARPAAAN